MKKIPFEIIKLLHDEYLSGKTIKELSKSSNISESLISLSFKENDLIIFKNRTKISQDNINRIVDLYNAGNSISDISKKINICVSQVWRMLCKRDINTNKTVFEYRDKLKKYTINENYFNEIDTNEKAYILGFLYADGNTNKKYYQITLKLQERDKNILEKMSILIGTNKPLHFIKKKKNTHQNAFVLKITNKIIYMDLIKYGLVPNKTFTASFPDIKNNLIPAFIRGYFDGDGCMHVDKKRKCGSVSMLGTTSFILSIKKILLEQLQINSYINHDKRIRLGVDTIRIRKFGDIEKLYNWMYQNSTIYLDRKYNKFNELKYLKRVRNDNI